MSAILDRLIVFGILGEISFGALAYGTTEAWSIAFFKVGAAILLLLWCIKWITEKRVRVVLPATAIPILAFLAVGLLQSLALTDSSGQRLSLSVDVEATRSAVNMLISLLILFLLAVNFLNTRERLNVLAKFLVLYGMALAVFALIQHFTCENCLYWVKTSRGAPFGTFPNRNHFAGYMELLMPVPLAILTVRAAGKWSMIYAFAAVLTGTATVMSLSRGGLLTLSAEIVFIAVLSKRVQRPGKERVRGGHTSVGRTGWIRLGPPVFVALLILAGVVWIGSAPIEERLGSTVSEITDTKSLLADSRVRIWKDTLTLIRANPVLGVGIGAFQTAFPLYDRSSGSVEIGASHNDYLQIVADAGIVGALIGLWFVVLVFRAIARATSRHDRSVVGLVLGAAAGIFGILVHSLFDFNLQIPANALLFLVFVAVISLPGPVTDSRLQTSAAETPQGLAGSAL